MTADAHTAPALSAIRPTDPVVDPPGGPELDLDDLIRRMAVRVGHRPEELAVAVVQSLEASQIRGALLQAVTTICRQRYAPRRPRREHPMSRPAPVAATPQPLPPVVPAVGSPRKLDAAKVLATLPHRLADKINVGSVKAPEWKLLGDCTTNDLFEAIENRRDVIRANELAAETYEIIHSALVEHRMDTVRALVRSGRLA